MDLELTSSFYHKIIAPYKINSIYGAILKLERAQSFEFIIVLFFKVAAPSLAPNNIYF